MLETLESTAVRHLAYLAAELGPRMTGSPAHRAAGDAVAAAFRAAGLEVEELGFDCPDWRADDTVLMLDGEPLPAAANVYSPPCDVCAPTVAACTLAELEAADLTGKIAVLYGELSRTPLSPKNNPLYQVEQHQQIIAALEAGRPAALLTVSAKPGQMVRVIEDVDFEFPSATVPAESGLRLLAAVGQPVHLRIASRRTPGWGRHVIGRAPGAGAGRVLVCAHYDTKVDTPGAWDNASGTAALMALAGSLPGAAYPLGVELVAFGDEESLGLDLTAYMPRCGDGLGDVLAAINLDGIGHRLAATSIMITAHSAPFEALVQDVVRRHPGVAWVEPWVESDHTLFAWHGVPALAISSTPWPASYHLPDDTVAWISGAKLAEAMALVTDIAAALRDKSPAWTRPAS